MCLMFSWSSQQVSISVLSTLPFRISITILEDVSLNHLNLNCLVLVSMWLWTSALHVPSTMSWWMVHVSLSIFALQCISDSSITATLWVPCVWLLTLSADTARPVLTTTLKSLLENAYHYLSTVCQDNTSSTIPAWTFLRPATNLTPALVTAQVAIVDFKLILYSGYACHSCLHRVCPTKLSLITVVWTFLTIVQTLATIQAYANYVIQDSYCRELNVCPSSVWIGTISQLWPGLARKCQSYARTITKAVGSVWVARKKNKQLLMENVLCLSIL